MGPSSSWILTSEAKRDHSNSSPQFGLSRFNDWPQFGRLQVEDVRVSRTGHGYHIEIGVGNDIQSVQLILLQAMLGSDIRRENHNLVRVNCLQMRPWNLLYDWKFRYYWKFRGHRTNEYRTLSRERNLVGLSKQIRRLIRRFQRRRKTSIT